MKIYIIIFFLKVNLSFCNYHHINETSTSNIPLQEVEEEERKDNIEDNDVFIRNPNLNANGATLIDLGPTSQVDLPNVELNLGQTQKEKPKEMSYEDAFKGLMQEAEMKAARNLQGTQFIKGDRLIELTYVDIPVFGSVFVNSYYDIGIFADTDENDIRGIIQKQFYDDNKEWISYSFIISFFLSLIYFVSLRFHFKIA